MKVLFLVRLYYPHIGGVEKHTLEVVKRLVKKGHRVVVITEALPRNFKLQMTNDKSISNDKFQIYKIPVRKEGLSKKFKIWWWLWRNRKLIEEADIVHAHDVGFWYFPFRFFYPKKPFFITFHGWEGKFPVPLKNKIIRKISEKLAWGNICVGDYISKWYGTKPNYVTHGGISFFPPPRGSPSATPEVSLPLIFIGRLEEDTGLPVYLKTLDQFSIFNFQFSITFFGEGRLRKKAEKYGKVLGFVREIRPCILQSRFVFTSGYLSILEAMIAKRLVFAVYNNPLKRDYLTMAPFAKWMVIKKNSKKLAEKIRYYFQHPREEQKMIDAAYHWAKEQTWEKVTDVYLKLWRKAK